MIEPVRLSKEELISRYGMTERLAVRVAALRARGLGASGALLEEALRSRSLGNFLLSSKLLEEAGRLDTAGLRRLGPAAKPLAIRDAVLCLAEELEGDSPAGSGLSVPKRKSPPAGPLKPGDARRLFPVEEIARLKMVLLTAVEAGAKVEALRRLALSPATPEEKGVLAMRAMADPAPEVRREGAAVLETIGLDPELAEALKTAASGSIRQKEMALQKVGLFGRRGGASERPVAMGQLIAALEFEKDASVLRATLAALSGYADLVAAHPDAVSALARNLVKILADGFAHLSSQARILLDDLGSRGGADAAPLLWKEVEGVGDRRIRTFFIEALFGMKLPEALERTLCRLAAEDLSTRPLEDLESRRLADALRLRGAAALETLLDVVPSLKEEGLTLVIPVMDGIASGTDIPAPLRNRAAEYFLRVLREGSRTLRTAIIEARLCAHPGLDPGLKRKLVADFMLNLHAYRAPRIHDLTAGAVRRIGLGAEEALVQCILKSSYPVERDMAARLLAEIAEAAEDSGEAVARIVKFLRAQEEGTRLPVALAVRSAGRAAHGPSAPAELVSEVLKDYAARVGKVAYNYDLLAALGWLASSPACDSGSASDVALKFMDLLDSPMPDPEVSETRTDEGMHLFVGAQTSVYTDLLPELLAGLQRILLAGRVSPGVRRRIAERLRERYLAVTEYREVWAPGNIVELGELMGALAATPGLPPGNREALIEALMTNLRNLATVRILGGVFSNPGEEDSAYLDRLSAFVAEVFRYLERPEYQERDDQRILLEALGRAGGNRRLAADRRESDLRRERIVEMLLEHASWLREAKPLLRALAASPNLPKALRKRAGEGAA
jgi:hypothetical protein